MGAGPAGPAFLFWAPEICGAVRELFALLVEERALT